MPKFYEIKAQHQDGPAEIHIYGDIGENWWDDEGITAKKMVEELAAIEVEELIVRINSYGGSVADGIAIYNAIKRHNSLVTVEIDGVAMSIASLIAMAGDEVRMAENAIFMVHAPWGGAFGNAAELREYADVLDKYADAMASSYMAKTGKSKEDVDALLKGGDDHYYTAEEALAEGFVDVVSESVKIAASMDLSRYSIPAAMAAALNPKTGDTKMPEPKKPAANPKPANPEPTASVPVKSDPHPSAEEVLAADKKRRETIRAAFKPFAAREGVQELMDTCMDDHAIDEAQARQKLLDHLGSQAQPLAGNPDIRSGETQGEKFVRGASKALLARAGVEKHEDGNEFRGMRLLDLAREALAIAGINARGLDPREIVGAAFTQSTSDFPILLESVMHKTLLNAYRTAPDTWRRFCRVGNVSDFRAHTRYRLGSFGNLDSLTELGEFNNKTIPDGEKETITASTKGNLINLSRQAIINDDLDAFNGLAAQLGRAAMRTIEADIYTLLASNPTMSDGVALFHANHGNLAASGAAMSVATIDAGRVAIASQQDVSSNDYLDIRPDAILCGISVGGDARVINDAQYDPDTANKLQRPNKVRGLVSDVIDTPRITGTEWYLFANPMDAPVLEVAFLDGVQDPYLETMNGWTVDGVQQKVRLDYGTAAIDYRGAYKNAGS